MLWNKGLDYIAYDICTLPSFPLKTYFFCLPLKITYTIAIPEDFHKILVYCWEIWENYASVNSRAQLELTDALNRGRSDIIRYYLMQLCIFFYIILIIWYNMNFVTFDMYFIKRINIITTIVHISQEILIKECFVQIACRWRRSTVSHLSLTAPRHFYYQHTWDEYLCLTPQSRLKVQSIFQGNFGSVQQKIEQKLGWQKKNRPLKFKIFWSVKESEESNIILIWISTLHRLLCFALHLGKSNSLSLKLEQWSNVLCESKWRRVTTGAKNAGSSLYSDQQGWGRD